MLQDLDSLADRLRQLVARLHDLQTERARQQTVITALQRERDDLRERLDQREAECADARAKLAQHTQQDAEQRRQHAAQLEHVQAQSGQARAQLQQDLFQCQDARDQAVAQLQTSQAQSQRLRSAAQQAHSLVDTLLLRLPGAGEE